MPSSTTRKPNNSAVPVAVLGDAYCDLVYGGLRTMPLPGFSEVCLEFEMRAAGSAGYTAMGLAALVMSVEIIAQVGEDPLSAFWLKQVREAGVSTRHVEVITSKRIGVSTVVLLPQERSFISFYGANAEPFCNLTTLIPTAYRLVFVTGFMQVPGLWGTEALTYLIKFCRTARACGVSILLDTNYDSSTAAVQAAAFSISSTSPGSR